MKKNYLIILGIFLILNLFIFRAVYAYTEYLDQENITLGQYCDGSIKNTETVGQTFIPTVKKITKIEIPFYHGPGSYYVGNFELILYDYSNLAKIKKTGSVQKTLDPNGGKWQSFIFSDEITVTPSNLYALFVKKVVKDNLPYQCWWQNDSKNPNPYPNGGRITLSSNGSEISTKSDMGFKVYGYKTQSINYYGGINKNLKVVPTNTPTPTPKTVSKIVAPKINVPKVVLNNTTENTSSSAAPQNSQEAVNKEEPPPVAPTGETKLAEETAEKKDSEPPSSTEQKFLGVSGNGLYIFIGTIAFLVVIFTIAIVYLAKKINKKITNEL